MRSAVGPKEAPGGKALASLSLAALGVVYGDIGTSPLYALKQCFLPEHGLPTTPGNILGVMSLLVWSMMFVVSFKYIVVLLQADNRGEGGILALLALVRPKQDASRARIGLVLLGLFGAALLYGDGVITPAISVLGAVEGISVATPAFIRYVVPITFCILLGLFALQKRGTAGVGRLFGPVMIIWFLCIGGLGVASIVQNPSVLRALSPWYGVRFFLDDGLRGFLILGSVVLVLTGGEALYADMGHFGPRPIRVAWFSLVLPALLLNYFGQAALLLRDGHAAANPFYALVPKWGLYPMVVIATAAAVTASQALISGAFSLTRQAVQLGYSPRVTIIHTSQSAEGQIYVPEVNRAIMVACLGLVVAFRSSDNLAAAYGIAVTGTMTITTILFSYVARVRWRWPLWRVGVYTGAFLVVDLGFLSANLVKVVAGGWFPLVLAALIYTVMTTWKRGRVLLASVLRESSLPLDLFIPDLARRKPIRVPGIAVFMTSDPSGVPPVMLHHLKHNKVLHEKVILMSVTTEEIPQVHSEDRVEFKELGEGLYSVIAKFGFMELPDVPKVLQSLAVHGLKVNLMETTFYLGRETLIPCANSAAMKGHGRVMSLWRKRLFVLMSTNARSATAFFGLPPGRVVELGAQIQI